MWWYLLIIVNIPHGVRDEPSWAHAHSISGQHCTLPSLADVSTVEEHL